MNILDLTENITNSQQDSFNYEQQQQLETIFHFVPQYCSLDAEQEIDSLLKNGHKNWHNTRTKIFSQMIRINDPAKVVVYRVCQHIVELHAEDSDTLETCFDKLDDIEATVQQPPLEFGANEAKIECETGTDFMEERFYKLPRTLKDMFDVLLEEV
ncbi:hypothetical protein HPULCUR_003825 [Helicostylum pulchrum]|uniref:Uncharacterized protein n=1 Tax=Helicostylum pulchrum TaxID=562976 RepID=A0ABP9XUI8_9FUNG